MLSLSGMSGSTGSGITAGGGVVLESMEAAGLGRHLAALREKLDDVCDEIVLIKVVTSAQAKQLVCFRCFLGPAHRSHHSCGKVFASAQSCPYLSLIPADDAPNINASWEGLRTIQILPSRCSSDSSQLRDEPAEIRGISTGQAPML